MPDVTTDPRVTSIAPSFESTSIPSLSSPAVSIETLVTLMAPSSE